MAELLRAPERGTGNDVDSVDLSDNRVIKHFCSLAAFGRTEVFQAIFVCSSCTSKNECICSACAEQCHAGHEVEYIGMGPSYCDCCDIGCIILEESIAEATRLGIVSGTSGSYCPCEPKLPPTSACLETAATAASSYIRDVYGIPAMADAELGCRLALQAKELVKHSRDSFWIDAETAESNEGSLCELELLAWKIFRRHVQHYNLEASSPGGSIRPQGAEWWVQVKPISLPPPLELASPLALLEPYANGAEAVDLHFDKDEAMAESFGLGLFPTLSTVSYLTNSVDAPPTLVFSRRYDQEDKTAISDMLVSHPAATKHLVFDGRLLHGAPSHFALRPLSKNNRNETTSDDPQPRITFIVNIWLDHKPAAVHLLPNEIRATVQGASKIAAGDASARVMEGSAALAFTSSFPVEQVVMTDALTDLPEALRGRIELPFVGGKATWVGDDDDEAMVLVTYPPPVHESDTLIVRFAPDLEAFLQYSRDDQDDDLS